MSVLDQGIANVQNPAYAAALLTGFVEAIERTTLYEMDLLYRTSLWRFRCSCKRKS